MPRFFTVASCQVDSKLLLYVKGLEEKSEAVNWQGLFTAFVKEVMKGQSPFRMYRFSKVTSTFTNIEKPTKILAVCSGTGVAPFLGYCRQREQQGKLNIASLALIYCLKDKDKYCIEKELLESNVDDLQFVESRSKPGNTMTLQRALSE